MKVYSALVLLAIIIQLHAKLTVLSVQGNDISVGADGSVWVIGNTKVTGGYNIYKRAPHSTTFKQISGAGGVRIAASPDGNAWIVNNKNQVLRYLNNKWQTTSETATDIGVGGDGSVWIVGTKQVSGGYAISKWNEDNNCWDSVSGGAVKITVNFAGEAWILNNQGTASYWNGKKWEAYGTSNKGVDIGSGSNAYLLSTKTVTGGNQVLEAEGNSWVAINDSGNYIGAIAVADDQNSNLYLVNNKNQVLYKSYN